MLRATSIVVASGRTKNSPRVELRVSLPTVTSSARQPARDQAGGRNGAGMAKRKGSLAL
jgi:hypothetical protein